MSDETITVDPGLPETSSSDYYLLDEQLTDEARDVRDRVRGFVEADLLPVINDYWDRAEFPFELVPKIARLGLVGSTISGYGCPGLSRLAAGILTRELARGDGSVNTRDHRDAAVLTDMEVVHTYEGTDSIRSLIVGRDLTGISAFT